MFCVSLHNVIYERFIFNHYHWFWNCFCVSDSLVPKPPANITTFIIICSLNFDNIEFVNELNSLFFFFIVFFIPIYCHRNCFFKQYTFPKIFLALLQSSCNSFDLKIIFIFYNFPTNFFQNFFIFLITVITVILF